VDRHFLHHPHQQLVDHPHHLPQLLDLQQLLQEERQLQQQLRQLHDQGHQRQLKLQAKLFLMKLSQMKLEQLIISDHPNLLKSQVDLDPLLRLQRKIALAQVQEIPFTIRLIINKEMSVQLQLLRSGGPKNKKQ